MSTVVGQRRISDTPANRALQAYIHAEELARHTIVCCANTTIFKEEYKCVLTDRIVDAAIEIMTAVGEANDIRVTSIEERDERLRLQRLALRRLKSLPRMLSIAKRLSPSKFRGRKLIYWVGLVEKTRELTNKWHESDVKRYSEESQPGAVHVPGEEEGVG